MIKTFLFSPRLFSRCCRALLVLSAVVLPFPVATSAQGQLDVLQDNGRQWMEYTDASNSLYHFVYRQAAAMLARRARAVSAIGDLSEWKQRQQRAREMLGAVVGPFPEKTLLNARTTAVVDEKDYRVENVIYESQPGFCVTASLFIPRGAGADRKMPAILYCSGHSDMGYRYPVYQHVIINLVKKGFIVLAFDPIGQGERREYLDPIREGFPLASPTAEHSYPGAQLVMTGLSLARCMIWDGIRSVDYLLTRKEVDPARIGITGRSGGGTQSAYIAAFDDRIRAAAPENYITSFSRLFQAIGPQDAEQNMYQAVEKGMDMADLLEVRAPRPTLMITTTRDMFPIQGALETYREVKRLYQAYGRPADFAMVTDDAPHASTIKNREAMYAFFQRYLDNPGSPEDLRTDDLDPHELQVTPKGQVLRSLKAGTLFSLNLKRVERQEALLDERRKNAGYLPAMIGTAERLSGYRDPGKATAPAFAGGIAEQGYTIGKYYVKGEGDYVIPYLLLNPASPNGKSVIYLNPAGKAVAASDAAVASLLKEGFTVLAPDLLGTGEEGPGAFKGDSYISQNSYNIWFFSMLIGRSIVGIQAGDVVRLARLLKSDAGIREVYGIALGTLSPALLHAAAFDGTITRVALIGPYISYYAVAGNMAYAPAFVNSTVPGSIGLYDLPDLAASLAPRRLLLDAPTDGGGGTRDSVSIEKGLHAIRAGYHGRGADAQLMIVDAASGTPERYISQWIN